MNEENKNVSSNEEVKQEPNVTPPPIKNENDDKKKNDHKKLNTILNKNDEKKIASDKPKKHNGKIILGCLILFIIIVIGLTTTNQLETITAIYNGSTEEGIVLNDDSDFTVTAHYSDDTSEKVNGWKIKNEETLKPEETSTVTIEYDGKSVDVDVTCSTLKNKITELVATYNGSTEEGNTVDKSNVTVTANFEDGTSKTIDDYTITASTGNEGRTALEAGKTNNYTITYKNATANLSVTCTTDPIAKLKAECQSIPYDELARNGDSYLGQMITFRGQILQVMEGNGYTQFRIGVTQDRWGYWSDDVVLVEYYYEDGAPRFLEDDIVTFYGMCAGLTSYESVMGATITIPSCIAEYMELS